MEDGVCHGAFVHVLEVKQGHLQDLIVEAALVTHVEEDLPWLHELTYEG